MTNENNEKNDWKFENNNWAVGIALILIGALFMLDTFNLVNINLTNWWAIFILIPGLTMTVNGWRRYQDNQSHSARNSAFWGLMLIILAFTFFFNIAWSFVFPLGLIGAGIYLFFFRK